MKTNELIERIDLALLNGEEVPDWLLSEYKKVRENIKRKPRKLYADRDSNYGYWKKGDLIGRKDGWDWKKVE